MAIFNSYVSLPEGIIRFLSGTIRMSYLWSLRWSVRVPPVACCVATSRAIADQMWTRLCAAGMRPEMIGNMTPWRFSPENGGKIYGFSQPLVLPMTSESKPM